MERALLERLAAIDSATLDRAGVGRAQALVADHLAGLGFTIAREAKDNRFGELIVAERPGRGERFLTLVSHVDTVLPNYRPFAIAGDRAFGSGVIDNKGGLAVGLGALTRVLAEPGGLALGLRFVSSPNEEMGSIGFTDRFRALARSSAVVLGLEPALDDGAIIHQRRGNRWYDVTVTGREAHAGRSYGRHANAAHDLAIKITRLAKLTKYRRHVSVSVGAIAGGKDKHNIVCGEARAKLDVRFPDFAARDRTHRRIEKILGVSHERSSDGRHRTRTTHEIVDDCPPFGGTARAKHLAKAYRRIAGDLEGRKVASRAAGGAGDVNYFSTEDNVVLDGFGAIGGEMHTTDEFLRLDSLDTRARALARFVRHVNQRV